MENAQKLLPWEEGYEIKKKIYKMWPVQDLKRKNFGFFCHFDQEFHFKTGLNIRKPDFAMLNKFLADPSAMIEEIIPPQNGWKY